MRKLNTRDVFAFMRVVKCSGIREELQRVAMSIGSSSDIKQVGLDTIYAVMEAMGDTKTEKAVYDFLAGPFEMEAEAVATMDLDALIANLTKMAEENDLSRFFSSAFGMSGNK